MEGVSEVSFNHRRACCNMYRYLEMMFVRGISTFERGREGRLCIDYRGNTGVRDLLETL